MSVLSATEPHYVPGQGWFAWDGARWIEAPTAVASSTTTGITIALSGIIGEGHCTPQNVRAQLARAGHAPIVAIDSAGGDVAAGFAIAEALAAHPSGVTARITRADSIASVIAQAGRRRIMLAGSSMFIHEVTGHVERDVRMDAAALQRAAAGLHRQADLIAKAYASRAGGTPQQWRQRMTTGTRYGPVAAVAAGLADEYA